VRKSQLDLIRQGYLDDTSWQDCLSAPAQRAATDLVRHPAFAGSTDPATLNALWLLVTRTKPERVLQIGTHIGLSALFLADVMRQQRPDTRLFTIEPDLEALGVAREAIAAAGLADVVTLVEGYSTDEAVADAVRPHRAFSLVYLDSSHSYGGTLRELEIIFEEERWLDAGGMLILHDAAREAIGFDPTGAGGVRRAIDEWMAERHRDYQAVILEPPLWQSVCGIALMRRVSGGLP